MGHFKINFRNKNEAGTMGIIGGADGPTAIFLTKREKHDKFLLHAAEQIIPCNKTFNQLEEYLTKKYEAVPHTLLPHQLETLKVNVILNHFDYVLKKPDPLGENPTEEEIRAYFEKDTSFLQAKEYQAEKLGLEFKAYKLINVPSQNKVERKQNQKKQNITANNSNSENDVIVEMEMNSEYLNILNGDEKVINDLLLFKGVSEKDIREKSPRFVAYAYALKFLKKI